MVGIVQGLLASYAAAAPPPPTTFRCTTFQISIACCTNVNECGELGAGVSCSPAVGFFNEDFC
jgi:hypothetical protein